MGVTKATAWERFHGVCVHNVGVPTSWPAAQVLRIAQANPSWFDGRTAVAAPTRLGTGESYDAWLVEASDSARSGGLDGSRAGVRVVLRLARRPLGELPADPLEELAALRLAPPGVGPRALGLAVIFEDGSPAEQDDASPRYPVMAEAFVPGEVLSAERWTGAMRRRLAGRLAALHTRSFAAPGSARDAEAGALAASGRLDFPGEIAGIVDYWNGRLVGPARDEWAPLIDPMMAYAERLAPEFIAVQEFSLIHGDPVLTNILVNGEEPHLVDWEWARIGDPARDLGFLGGAVHAQPWYAPLDDREITDFLQEYVEAGGRGEVAQLRVRRDAWLAAEGFAVLAYLLWVETDRAGGLSPANRRTLAGLRATLPAYLRRAPGVD